MSRRLISVVMLQRTLKARVSTVVNEAYKNVQKAPLFAGIAREYTPKAEEGQKLPSEALQVQLVASSLISAIATDLGQLWDLTATRDAGNQVAKGNVVVRGRVILNDVSSSNLLFLEKQLIDVRTFITACPVLDTAKEWTTDEITGISRTRPVETTRSEKIEETVVVVPPNERHPAQTRDRVRDQIVGTWATTHLSGALTALQQHKLINRVNELIDAVKIAREEANLVTVEDVKVGDALFGFLLEE